MELQPVTAQNWKALIKLKVGDDQTHFVASNLYSIAEAQFGFEDEGHWDFYPFGAYVFVFAEHSSLIAERVSLVGSETTQREDVHYEAVVVFHSNPGLQAWRSLVRHPFYRLSLACYAKPY